LQSLTLLSRAFFLISLLFASFLNQQEASIPFSLTSLPVIYFAHFLSPLPSLWLSIPK